MHGCGKVITKSTGTRTSVVLFITGNECASARSHYQCNQNRNGNLYIKQVCFRHQSAKTIHNCTTVIYNAIMYYWLVFEPNIFVYALPCLLLWLHWWWLLAKHICFCPQYIIRLLICECWCSVCFDSAIRHHRGKMGNAVKSQNPLCPLTPVATMSTQTWIFIQFPFFNVKM